MVYLNAKLDYMYVNLGVTTAYCTTISLFAYFGLVAYQATKQWEPLSLP